MINHKEISKARKKPMKTGLREHKITNKQTKKQTNKK
jgi:hypothetical protein